MDSDPATLKFAQALPYVLLPASPQLAALHSARTRTVLQAACPRCGADPTLQHTRVVRSKQPRTPQPTRVILTTCTACDAVSSVPLHSANVPSFSSRRKAKTVALQKPQAPSTPVVSEPKVGPLPLVEKPSLAVKPVKNAAVIRENRPPVQQPSSSNKKKSSLQQMLERNREKENNKAKTSDAKPSGLSAFLSAL